MAYQQNPLRLWPIVILLVAIPLMVLFPLFLSSDINYLPWFSVQEALAVSLAAMQVTLAALAIFIGVGAILGYAAIRQAAERVAADRAEKVVDAYLETSFPESERDATREKLKETPGDLPERGNLERRATDVGDSAVS